MYLENLLGGKIDIDIRDDFISHHHRKEKDLNELAKKLAESKVFDISDPTKKYDPFPVEIEHEKGQIISPKRTAGVMYDGVKLQNIFFDSKR
jgi:hypothetical protein